MKCGACGYERIVKYEIVDDVVRYKSGKRKGEVKEINTKEITLAIGHADFKKLYFKKDVDTLVYDEDNYSGDTVEPTLYACPACGTVRIDS